MLEEELGRVIRLLEAEGIAYALAGGLVASLYRQAPRATADIDVAVLCSADTATMLLKRLGRAATPIRRAQLEGGPLFAIKRKSTPVVMVKGQMEKGVAVDFLLSDLPWVEEAIQRAQSNRIQFGRVQCACLTPEDLVLSKLVAYRNRTTRYMDLDDIQQIFDSRLNLDLAYLKSRMRDHGAPIPKQMFNTLPHRLKELTRR